MSSTASAASLRMSSRLSGTKSDMDGEKDGESMPTPTPRASAAAAARRAALAERAALAASETPRPSPLDRSSAIGERTSGLDRSSSMNDRTSGSGLSDYTSKRLEELRLRRAESAADSYSDYRSRREAKDKSDTSSISSTGSSDYMEIKMRRERERERVREDNLKDKVKEKENADTKPSVPTSTPNVTSSVTSSTVIKREKPPIKEKPVDYRPKSENKDDEFVGFATLPDQVHRKAVKRGFDFTLMVVGETGLGKSTLITSLFLNDLYKDRKVPPVEERVQRTVGILKNNLEIEEKGVKLRLTIVDTPGFNDSVNAEDSWKPIEDYVDNQFDQYFKDESGLNRKNIKDNRVHCCLYFIPPFGHGLRQIDITFMKRLHEKVNIVPVIAKADTLTPSEIRKLKSRVLEQIEQHRIKIYEFPECDSDEDDEFKQMDKELKESIPFAVIGSNTTVEVNGRKVRGRLYPWGIVEVDNPKHCDFSKLRTMLISTHMQDLKELTRDYHYENYRAKYIKEQMNKNINTRNTDGITNVIVNTVRQGKLKRDSTNFDNIIETDKLLEQKDEEIRRMQEMLLKMQQQLHSNRNQQMNGLGNL